jgi:UDP-N-acetylmuramyl pentapeptide synthase
MLINDTYNANPASLTVALEVLKQCPGEKWLALGAFGELGADSESIARVNSTGTLLPSATKSKQVLNCWSCS